ncbi:DMT family transporter [uncultured Nocardioides sp.]|uniref:DMT family transporter n=1 Tax=uncultured Nocardioides sp. TaxID=198441 RepID=UPI002612F9EE|nr:DMT family transporter [uncultured Nocardioides sp.]
MPTLASPRTGGLPLLPAAAFVLVWSSGYVVTPIGVDAIAPLWILAMRFALAGALAAVIALALRRRVGASRRDLGRIALVGIVLNGVVFSAMFSAFGLGLDATFGALVHSLSPVLTVVLAGLLLRERLTRVQVVGFVVGVLGVLLVLIPDLEGTGGPVAIGLALFSLLGLSLGTLGQRWIGDAPDPLWSTAVQCAASAPFVAVLALLVEDGPVVSDPVVGLVALAYMVVGNSLAGLLLLGLLVRAGGAGAASATFFLMPPVTAVLAYVFLGDVLGPVELVGLLVAAAGVAAATLGARPRDEEPPPVAG